MDKILKIWANVLAKLTPFWHSLVWIVEDLSGLETAYAQLAIFVVLGYVVAIFVTIKIHTMFIKSQKKKVKKCVFEYDRVRYLINKAMYDINKKMKNSWKSLDLEYGTKSVLQLKKKDYLYNRKKIFSDIKKLEKYLWQEIVSSKVLKKISALHGRIGAMSLIQHLIGWGLVILTFGLYALKWERVYYK